MGYSVLFPVEWIRLSLTRYSLWSCSSISYWIIKVSLWLTSLRSFYFFKHVSHSVIPILSRSVTGFTHTRTQAHTRITMSTSCPLSLCHLVFQSLPDRGGEVEHRDTKKGRGSVQLVPSSRWRRRSQWVNAIWTDSLGTDSSTTQEELKRKEKKNPIVWRLFSFWICGLKGR